MHRCDPRAKLLAFLGMAPLVVDRPVDSVAWGMTVFLVMVGWFLAGATWGEWWRWWWRWRWWLVAVLVTHGWLTPGESLGGVAAAPTWEGLSEGVRQSLRLMVLSMLAMILMRTTPARRLLALLVPGDGRRSGRIRAAMASWLAVLAFSLGVVGSLFQTASQLWETVRLRRPRPVRFGWWGHLTLVGQAWFVRLLVRIGDHESALRCRGYGEHLPRLSREVGSWRGGEVVLLLVIALPWMAR